MNPFARARHFLPLIAFGALLSGCADVGPRAEAAAYKARAALHQRFDKTEPGWDLSIERPPSAESLASERKTLDVKPISGSLIEAQQWACWLTHAPKAPLLGINPCKDPEAMEADSHWGLSYFPARYLVIYRKEFRQGRPISEIDLEMRAATFDMRALAAGLNLRHARFEMSVSEFAGSDAGLSLNYLGADPASKGALDFSATPYAYLPAKEIARAPWTDEDRGVAQATPPR